MDNAGFDAELARKQACELVRLKRGMFTAYPDLDREELVSHCLEKLLRDYRNGKYDPTKGASFGTWAWRVMSCDLLDLSRVRGRERVRVQGVEPKESWVEEDKPAFEGAGEGASIVEMAGALYRQVSHNVNRYMPARKGAGRPTEYTPAQRLVVGVIMRRKRLSCRAATMLLRDREDVRRAIGMGKAPSLGMVHAMKLSVQKFVLV